MNSKDYKYLANKAYNQNGKTVIIITFLIANIVLAVSSFVSVFFIGPVLVGLAYFTLNTFRVKKSNIEDVLHPGVSNYVKVFLAGIIKAVFVMLWSLLLIIPGIIKSYSYAMTEFIVADEPDLDPFVAITKSREMMNGNKFKLFKLHLSFIGWILLCIITFGIATIYVIPYIKLAETVFYLGLINDSSLAKFNDTVEVVEEVTFEID